MTLIHPEPGFQGHRSFSSSLAQKSRYISHTERTFLPERDCVMLWYLLSQIRLSVVCLSLTFVCRTQGVEAFGNISSLLCTLAIL